MKTPTSTLVPTAVLLIGALVSATTAVDLQYDQIKSFGFRDNMGVNPQAGLIQGSDGALYGTTAYGGTASAGTAFKLNRDGSGYHVLHHFGASAGDGQSPLAALIEASDGAFYGTTSSGSSNGWGTVFKINKDGSGYATLHSFAAMGLEGQSRSALHEGSDGSLYGTTINGGSNDVGTIFKLLKHGSGFMIVHSFAINGSDGREPHTGLIESSDGALYGTTAYGGSNDVGTVFRIDKDGNGFSILHAFSSVPGEGQNPGATLLKGSDGTLYGTTSTGGSNSWGTVFKLNQDGSGYRVLRSFGYPAGDGGSPSGELVEGTDGALYGTTFYTTFGFSVALTGTEFKLNRDGSGYNLLFTFPSDAGTGLTPFGIVKANDGAFYGTAVFASPGSQHPDVVFKLSQSGTGYAVLHQFSLTGGDAQNPDGDLVQGGDGEIYGATKKGDLNSQGEPRSPATLFAIKPDGTDYRTLHTFTITDEIPLGGGVPYAGLVQGSDGVLYGTTRAGGTNGTGTVFKVNNDGNGYEVLYSFDNAADAPKVPNAGIIQASRVLYGTTVGGGNNYAGTVFRLSLDGRHFQALYHFGATATDGVGPQAGLLEGSDGALYGTTSQGGSNAASYGCCGAGTVFSLNKDGSGYAILHSFRSFNGDGQIPTARLIEGSDGALYGTTIYGGGSSCFDESGALFRLDKNGSNYTVLHSFCSINGEGWRPAVALAQSADGALYGTTTIGGSNGVGTVFRINKDGTGYETVHTFGSSGGDGQNPYGALLRGNAGALYGTTLHGGESGFGALFRLLPNGPPSITCPSPSTIECAGPVPPLVARVADPDGDPLTIVWNLNGVPVYTNALAGLSGPPPRLPYPLVPYNGPLPPLGSNLLELTVTDSASNSASCSTSLIVEDSQPPIVSNLSADPDVLWPPNQKWVDVRVRARAADTCSSASWKIIRVTSDDGGSASDWQITGNHTLKLRAERSGKGDGRTYTITVQATARSGNFSDPATVTVKVPRSQGKGR